MNTIPDAKCSIHEPVPVPVTGEFIFSILQNSYKYLTVWHVVQPISLFSHHFGCVCWMWRQILSTKIIQSWLEATIIYGRFWFWRIFIVSSLY